jgi:hypothetical protein
VIERLSAFSPEAVLALMRTRALEATGTTACEEIAWENIGGSSKRPGTQMTWNNLEKRVRYSDGIDSLRDRDDAIT